ncbi:MAG: hypothetical protein ACUVXH_06935, partial [Anaerolineae bacterium]
DETPEEGTLAGFLEPLRGYGSPPGESDPRIPRFAEFFTEGVEKVLRSWDFAQLKSDLLVICDALRTPKMSFSTPLFTLLTGSGRCSIL